jgi:hypothetical protein
MRTNVLTSSLSSFKSVRNLLAAAISGVSGDKITVVTNAVDTGHTVQIVNVPERFHVLTHAVMLDGWGTGHGAGGSQSIDVCTTSPLWNGTSGPLGRMIEQRFTPLGSEQSGTIGQLMVWNTCLNL